MYILTQQNKMKYEKGRKKAHKQIYSKLFIDIM